MTDMSFDTADHSAAIRLGQLSIYWLTGLAVSGLLLLAGANWVVANAIHGLVAVLGGA